MTTLNKETITLTTEQELQAWKKAEERAVYFSERIEHIRNKKIIKNEGQSRTAKTYINACREDIIDKIIDAMVEKELAENVKKEQDLAEIKYTKNGRYVELLITAEKNNLNHGKSWNCSSSDVDTKFLPPHWDSEQICYVYE